MKKTFIFMAMTKKDITFATIPIYIKVPAIIGSLQETTDNLKTDANAYMGQDNESRRPHPRS